MSAHESSFVLEPRHDMFVYAIGIKEHGGCVHGVRYGICLRVWFGTSRKSFRQVQKETIEEFQRKLESQKKYFQYALAGERESHRKNIKELIEVCENIVISEIYDVYFVLCSCVFYHSMCWYLKYIDSVELSHSVHMKMMMINCLQELFYMVQSKKKVV